MVRYAENPTTQAEVHIAAPPSAVWPLISDISLPARLSTELVATEWIDGATGPCAGARFRGRSHHGAVGTWETVSTVVTCDEPRAFRWVVGDPGDPAARWGFEIEATEGGTYLRQWATLGPGPSGLTPAIEAMPDKEERIIARRLAEHQANMRRCVTGIKELAERAAG